MINKILLKISCWLYRSPKLKRWSLLEDKKKLIIKAVEDNSPDFPDKVENYLSTAFSIPIDTGSCYWKDSVEALLLVVGKSSISSNIPLVTIEGPKQKEEPWEYSGRSWYVYANMLAGAYGWDYEKIAKLDVADALALIQEILVDDQLEKEFYHHLSEISYVYDKSTKKSEYKKLPRPSWMVRQGVKNSKPVKIEKRLLPVGNVVNLVDEAKKIKPE